MAYHVLWEVAHVFLDAGLPVGAGAPAKEVDPAMASLYPMLYATSDAPGADDLEEAALASVRAKLDESAIVRARARDDNAAAIERAADALRDAPTVFTCGNGGSATDAADLAYLLGERGRSLSGDIATVTALSNDVSFDVAFARPLATLGRTGDAVVRSARAAPRPTCWPPSPAPSLEASPRWGLRATAGVAWSTPTWTHSSSSAPTRCTGSRRPRCASTARSPPAVASRLPRSHAGPGSPRFSQIARGRSQAAGSAAAAPCARAQSCSWRWWEVGNVGMRVDDLEVIVRV